MTKKLIFCLSLLLLVVSCGDGPMQSQIQEQEDQFEADASAWPSLENPLTPDPKVEDRITSIIAKMSIEEKVGQIIQAEIQYTTPEDVKEFHLGSVLNGGGSLPNRNKYASPQEWLAMADGYYEASMDESDGGVAIPIIWGSDAVHGHNNVIGATIFPHNIGLGATRDPALMREIGRVTAREMRVTGIDWTFAPTVAVGQDDRWGRLYESFSEDPEVVRQYAREFVIGLQGEPGTPEFLDSDHVVATAKHFIGDGGTEGGDDQGDTQVSEDELRDIHGPGYFAALEAGVQSVMASFSSWNGEKLHGHQYLLTDVLKNRLGLDGLVVGDWNGHGQLPGCTNASCPDAINAGLDLFMAIEDWKDLYRNTLTQVKDGTISEARLDDAVRRILRVKIRAGLFEKGKPSVRGIAGSSKIIGSEEHRNVARRAVRQSLVVLKNQGNLLPISPSSHVLVTGDGADNMSKQTGGWTITWQGTDNTNEDFPGGTTILDGIRQTVEQSGGIVTHSENGEFDERPDVAIVVFGEDPYAEFQGDLDTLEFEPVHKSSLKLLKKLKDQGIPVVSVFLSGRPLWVNPELNASDAFVAAWLPGSEGVGVADVLIGGADGKPVFDATGVLPFSWPKSPLQAKLNKHHAEYEPLFEFGYGLDFLSQGELAVLEEDVEGVRDSDAGDLVLYHGRPLAPWVVFLEGDVSEASIMSGPYAAHVSGQIVARTADMEVQEDAIKVEYTGTGKAAIFIGGSELDLSRFHGNGELSFFLKLEGPKSQNLALSINDAEINLWDHVEHSDVGDWQNVSVPLSCFVSEASDLSNVVHPFRLSASENMTLSIGRIEFKLRDESVPCS